MANKIAPIFGGNFSLTAYLFSAIEEFKDRK